MACFLVTLRLGLQDLFFHRRIGFVMSISIAITTALALVLVVYRTGFADKYTELAPDLLLVHESQSLGEFYGSRLSSHVGEVLSKMGIQKIIPEIRALASTSAADAILIRGVDLKQYTELEPFTILSGQSLQPGDPPRLAMIGWRLSKSRNVATGESIALRGRDFKVVGIYKNGTYMDNQAWISISDAQMLLGWGDDVSTYIIPDEGIVHEGDEISNGIIVSRKGESLKFLTSQLEPIFKLLQIVLISLMIATSVALTNILWRLSWLRKREMAILRTTGFPAFTLSGFLLSQVVIITLLGILMGGLMTLIFTTGVKLAVPSFTIVPRMELQTIYTSLGWIVFLVFAGSLLPAWGLSHMNLSKQLHSD